MDETPPNFAQLSEGDGTTFLVRWRGRKEGPYPPSVIQAKLIANEFSLLHEILHGDKWVTIRDYLTEREALLQAELQARHEQQSRAPADQSEPHYVTCQCQHCNGHIAVPPGQVGQSVECPHCHMETILFRHKPKPPEDYAPRRPIIPLAKELILAVFQTTATQRFERIVFTIIRCFALFWSCVMLLMLGLAAVNYAISFFPSSATANNQNDAVATLVTSGEWRNFGLYASVSSVLLTMLTFVSIVLVLLAIERNTRRKD
jgi:hypothetical protein